MLSDPIGFENQARQFCATNNLERRLVWPVETCFTKMRAPDYTLSTTSKVRLRSLEFAPLPMTFFVHSRNAWVKNAITDRYPLDWAVMPEATIGRRIFHEEV
jgi:hypothetical protein